MDMVVNGKKITKFYYNGVNYLDGGGAPSINHTYTYTPVVNISASVASQETSGYSLTFSMGSNNYNSFKIYRYNDVVTPLTSIPTHYFKLATYEIVDISEYLNLVYDGNELFHYEILQPLPSVITKAKIAPAVKIYMVDENNNVFLTTGANTGNILTFSNSSITQDYTAGTITSISGQELTNVATESDITLPYSLEQVPSEYDLPTNYYVLLVFSGDAVTGGATITTTHELA